MTSIPLKWNPIQSHQSYQSYQNLMPWVLHDHGVDRWDEQKT